MESEEENWRLFLLWGNFSGSFLLPLWLIEIVILVLYFVINFYMSDKTQQILLKEVSHNLHNPARKSVWTSVYLDPVEQGWMVSNIVPMKRS